MKMKMKKMLLTKKDFKNYNPSFAYKYEYFSKFHSKYVPLEKTDSPFSLLKEHYKIRYKKIYAPESVQLQY